MKRIFIAIAFLGMFATTFAAGPPPGLQDTTGVKKVMTINGVTLAGSATCEEIEEHAPVKSGATFSKDVGKVWVYSKFTLPKGTSSTIKHVYFLNDQPISMVTLDVRGPSFRTNSYKTITKNMTGDWKVEIQAENGEVFETLDFTITE